MPLKAGKKTVVAAALAVYVVGGVLVAIPLSSTVMTEMFCMCDGDQDVECNDIRRKDYVFFTGVFNVYIEKAGKEIVLCEGGERTGTEHNLETQGYRMEFLHFR